MSSTKRIKAGEAKGAILPDMWVGPYSRLVRGAAAIQVSELDAIANGGVALIAYGKLQYTDMSWEERQAIRSSLLKYCELDTLAMVMIWEGFVECCK